MRERVRAPRSCEVRLRTGRIQCHYRHDLLAQHLPYRQHSVERVRRGAAAAAPRRACARHDRSHLSDVRRGGSVALMCGRFQASSSPAELARWFKTTGRVPNLQQRYNAAPGQRLPIVLRGSETRKRRLVTLRWGLIPHWAKDAKIGYLKINAMAEMVACQPAFRDAFKRRRCLVPAD